MNVGDFVSWIDQEGIRRSGIIAYVANPGDKLPEYLTKYGCKYKSFQATFGRYIVDCGPFEFNGYSYIEYRAVSFNNPTLKEDIPYLDLPITMGAEYPSRTLDT